MRLTNPFVLGAAALLLGTSFGAQPAAAQVVRQDETEIGKQLNLPIYEWKDEAVPDKALIFAIHGATLYAKRYETAANHFAQLGYPVVALDLRGFGSWRTEGEKFDKGDRKVHYTASEDDIVNVLQALRKAHPQEKIYCLGESLGANLAVWLGSDHPELVDGLILISPCIRGYLHPGPRIALTALKGLLDPSEQLHLSRPIRAYLCDDREATEEYLADPGIYHDLTGIDLVKSLKTNTLTISDVQKIPAAMPVLIVAGKIDHIYKASAVPPFADEMGSKQKTVEIVPNRGHLLIEYSGVTPQILGFVDTWLGNTISPNTIAHQSDANKTASTGSSE